MKKEVETMENSKKNLPVGVFDSGVGGISVLRNLHQLMPAEDFIFFGDSKNAPYGIKTTEEVKRLSFAIVEHFLRKNVKAIVIACNTATSAAVDDIRVRYPELPVIGLEPAVKPAVERKKNSHILVMATPLTLREEKFTELMEKYEKDATLIPVPAPTLVEFVERGELNSEEVHAYLKKLLTKYKGKTDAIVLGCTHFPFIKEAVRDVVGPEPFIVDGGPGAARELQRVLKSKDLLRTDIHQGQVEFFNSEPGKAKIELSEALFNALKK
ncbi:glutamate racemase [Liquorilactobacillus uvarum DSM 19971]|uniref:Glutamate racemase n=2 Tax=Liquorilactobacillus uvarum TaxID=303240 RepID=A0A0R1Q311_9LACO|nr:glutamate racemase [Liquorilactobacillus uvarum DSM 19971]